MTVPAMFRSAGRRGTHATGVREGMTYLVALIVAKTEGNHG